MGCQSERGFNTQPPEGGWRKHKASLNNLKGFNTQPPEGGWSIAKTPHTTKKSFNTQPPKGGWVVFKVRGRAVTGFQHTAA